MPPSKTPKVKQKSQEDQREEALQAVVLADSFETRFVPFTLERPRCLLPLANTPLIEYTLEFLANTGVQEVFLSCRNHADQVEEYISKSKWKLKSSPFHVLTIIKSTLDSAGGVMRDLERAEIITGDFLLVSGDVVSNMSLEPALAKHRARREKDKNAIMTMLLREAGVEHRTKSNSSRPIFVIDPKTERCLHYEEMGRRKGGNRHITLDPEILTSSSEIEVREDLIDCRVDICTQDVLLAWSDNFDYTSVRKSFLRGVLKDYETYGKTVHTHIVDDKYAARVKSMRAYNAISRDILGRWTYPFCPDSNLIAEHSYRLGRNGNLQEAEVSLSRSATVRKSIVGRGTSVGDHSTIGGSTLGRRCKIGKGVNIDGAYIWDGVSVGDGCTIRQAIIANNVTMGKNCKIDPAALVAYGVQLQDNTVVSEARKVTKDQCASRSQDSDASSVESAHLIYGHPSASISLSSISTLASSDADMEPLEISRRGSMRSDPSDDVAENRDFHLEATASILDGLQKEDPPDTIILELNGYRMSTNASQHEVRKALVSAFLKRIANLVASDTASGNQGLSTREAVNRLFKSYKALVERTIFDEDATSKVDQIDFLLLVQREVSNRPNGDQLMLFIAKEAYDQELVEEDGVLQWWEDERSQAGDLAKVRALTQQLITYLQEAEEEDESEDEDEDDVD